jgi:serine/threonine protein kinase
MRRSVAHSYLVANREYYESLAYHGARMDQFHDPVRALLPPDWHISRHGPWFHCHPPCADHAPQGWKIHISTTFSNARQTLEAIAPICAARRTSFKFALDAAILTLINGKAWPREQGGKFITIYPRDKAQFSELLEATAAATARFEGPTILTDRRYRDSRVVYYRYGGIVPVSRRDVTGREVTYLVGPDGQLVEDQRRPEFVMPDWVSDPCAPSPSADDDATDVPTLRQGQYTVLNALSFSNSGGVYLAYDNASQSQVVIKEARPHIHLGYIAADAVALLKREFDILQRLSPYGIAPAPIELFQEWEHWFLVEQYLEGKSLGRHAVNKSIALVDQPTAVQIAEFWANYRSLFAQLADHLARLHSLDLVFGDLSLNNVFVDPETETLTLIDLETAHWADETEPPLGFTYGYAPSTRMQAERPSMARDLYALGAMMVNAIVPVTALASVKPDAVDAFLQAWRADLGLPQDVERIMRTLLEINPAARPSAEQVRDRLRLSPPPAPGVVARRQPPPHDVLRRIVDRALDYVVGSARYDRHDRVFPAHPAVFTTNPVNVAYGACGVAHVLLRTRGECPPGLVEWIRSYPRDPRLCPPGLYTGLAGLAWTLRDLGLPDEADEALQAALTHPRLLDSTDMFNGLAGVGTAALAAHLDSPGCGALDKARWCAERLIEKAEDRDEGLCWRARDGFVYYGYGYGASGPALFLLYLHLLTGESRWLEAGRRSLAFELAHGIRIADRLSWSYNEGSSRPQLTYLEFGSAGVGAALLRYYVALGDEAYREPLDAASRDALRKYATFPGYLLGIAGDGQFAVDQAVIGGLDARWAEASALADSISLFAIERPEGVAFPGEHFYRISCDFGTGAAGIALFLHNMLSRQTSSFMLDRLLTIRHREQGEPARGALVEASLA